MRRRGRRPLGLGPCLAQFERVAELHARGFGTTEIQAELSIRRDTISRIRAILRLAEERGRESVAGVTEAAERRAEPFPKYPEARE